MGCSTEGGGILFFFSLSLSVIWFLLCGQSRMFSFSLIVLVGFSGLLLSCCNSGGEPLGGTLLERGLEMNWNFEAN